MSVFRSPGRAAAALACLSLFAGLGGISLNSPAQRFVLARAASFLGPPLPSHAQTRPTVTIVSNSSQITEGGAITFTIRLSDPAPAEGLTVRYNIGGATRFFSHGNPAIGQNSVTIINGARTQDISLSTEDDNIDEENGAIVIRILSSASYTATQSQSSVSITVLDNDETRVVSQSNNVSFNLRGAGVLEGSGIDKIQLSLHIEPPFNTDTSIAYTVEGTASESSDFTISKSSPIVIPANATRVNMPITIIDDAVSESDETLIITIPEENAKILVDRYTNPFNPRSYYGNQFKLTIRDDDGLPEVSVGRSGAAFSGDLVEGGDATFDIFAYPPPAADLPVSVTVSAVGDYGVTTGTRTVTVPAGSTSVNLSLSTTNDTVDEPDGSVTVAVTSDSSYKVGPVSSNKAFIKDNDSRSGRGDLSLAARIKEERKRYGKDVKYHTTLTRALIAMKVEPLPSFTNPGIIDGPGHWVQAPLTVTEAQTYADQGWSLWDEIVEELKRLRIGGSNSPVPKAASSPPQAQVNTTPRVNVTAAGGGGEGADVTFVITANPAPTAALPVSVTVTAAGDYGISTGARTVSIPTGGSFTLRLPTTDDTVDEEDGSVTLTVNAGEGYTVGALSSQTASITDDDVATQQQQQADNTTPNPYAAYAALIATVRGYVGETVNGEEHVKRWQRVLKALGEDDAAFAGLTPMTASEAQTYADRGWSRWEPVATALTALEAASNMVAAADNDTPLPTISIAGGSAVTEGGDVTFTLTASPAPAASLPVTVSVTENGNVAGAGATGTRTVTIGTDGTVDFTVATEDDATDEADGSIAATVTAGTGYTVGGTASTAIVSVADNDVSVSTKPMLSVSDATGQEGEALEFVIRLSRPLEDGMMAVLVRTRESTPVSARQGQDFRLRPDGYNYAVVYFRSGETEKTVSVSTVDDAHDDDGETFELYIDKVYFADVGIADGVGVGTIRNSDPIPAAWLGRFGRTVSQQVVDAVRGRFKAAQDVAHGGLDLTVAGENLSGELPLEENEGALRKLLGFESVSGEQLVADSSFSFSPQSSTTAGDGGAGEDGAGQLSVWGQGAVSSFRGREEDLSLSGDVTTALLGADWRGGPWQAGAALSHSWGSGGYAGEGDNDVDGSISAAMLGLFPYGRYALTPRLGIWALGGYGWGNLTLKPQGDDGEELNTTTNLVMGAVGLEGVVLDGGAAGLSLTTTADALVVETASAETTGLKGSAATVSRLRLGLEATRPAPLANGASLLPSLEVGIRQDGGDAETGYGVEVGAGLVWKDPQRGIRGEVQGRTLVTHTEEEFRQQGLALSFAWEPSPDKRGPSLSMGHTMGASASGGMDALLQPVVLEGLAAPGGNGQQFEAELAYGFPFYDDRLTITPGMTLALSPDSRTYGLLWSLAPYSQQEQEQEQPWEVSLEAQRRESALPDTPVDHSVGLNFSLAGGAVDVVKASVLGIALAVVSSFLF